MTFDPNPHILRMVVIQCGNLLFPNENNVTVLYEKMVRILGIAPFKMTTRISEFDANYQMMRLIVINAGDKLRAAKGLPKEEDKEKLFAETLEELGLPPLEPLMPEELSSKGENVNHLPAPHEMKNDQGKFTIPRKDCPQCGRKDGLSLKSICPSCADSEGGKYHTMYSCEEMGSDRKPLGCGFKTEKSEKFMAQRMSELNPSWEGGMKQDMGIKTITDNGIK